MLKHVEVLGRIGGWRYPSSGTSTPTRPTSPGASYPHPMSEEPAIDAIMCMRIQIWLAEKNSCHFKAYSGNIQVWMIPTQSA